MISLHALRELALDLAALVWPTACVCCEAPDRDCCAACLQTLQEPVPPRRVPLGVPAFVRGSYDGVLRAMLVAYKHENRVAFRRHLGPQLRPSLLAALARSSSDRAPLIVPAPSRPSRVRARGYRHIDLMLRVAMRGWRIPQQRALRTTRGRVGQVGLDAESRRRNAARIRVRSSARWSLHGREVVIVDDVITTGATVDAARIALEDAGAKVIAIVALCVAERWDTRRTAESGNGESEWSRLPERRKGAPHWPTA